MCIKKQLIFLFLFLWIGISSCQKSTDSIRVVNPQCENRIDPLGIDALSPRLSWNSESSFRNKKQSAYQIIVSDTHESLANDKGNLWDTNKVNSDRSIQIQYQGKPLSSEMTCYWKVRVWDEKGNVSGWSNPAHWEMGLLNLSDWQADWINDGKAGPQSIQEHYEADPAPLFRCDFKTEKEIKKARLYISGLGYYEATINGKKVGDHVLDPGWTNYDKRVLYTTYNVTDQIKEGGNSIGVTLGNGWFNPLPIALFGKYNLRENLSIGRPKFIAHLKICYTDGSIQTIVSNEEWKTSEGPIIRNNIYLGEVYDARKEIPGWDTFGFDDHKWHNAKIASGKTGLLQAQNLPPIKITGKLNPVKLTEPIPEVYIFDMGQNFSGWVTLKVKAEAGTYIKELIHGDSGRTNPSISGLMKDECTVESLDVIHVE